MAQAGERQMQVLIVDDDEVVVEGLRSALDERGYDVLVARDGHEALRLLNRTRCRLVISDWMMPVMDGLELCRRIRERDGGAAYIYIILLSSRESVDDVVSGLAAGADDFLTKPCHAAELEMRLRVGERILSLETRDLALFAMARLAESRDPETGRHLERIRVYAELVARQLQSEGTFPEIDAEFLRLLYLTSPLHDIGKIGIPDSVLLKPGCLTDREFEIMKTHTTIGAGTLSAAMRQYPDAKFLRMARDIALTHHERYDGQGYPAGLAGDAIPLVGRIVALADVYDALTSRRAYKDAFSHDIALSMIREESGRQFDPRVVSAFEARELEFMEVRERLCGDREGGPPALAGTSVS